MSEFFVLKKELTASAPLAAVCNLRQNQPGTNTTTQRRNYWLPQFYFKKMFRSMPSDIFRFLKVENKIDFHNFFTNGI